MYTNLIGAGMNMILARSSFSGSGWGIRRSGHTRPNIIDVVTAFFVRPISFNTKNELHFVRGPLSVFRLADHKIGLYIGIVAVSSSTWPEHRSTPSSTIRMLPTTAETSHCPVVVFNLFD